MCRTITASLTTFGITAACMLALVLYSPGPKTYFLAFFMVSVAAMQLVDTVIWFSLKYDLPALNRFASIYLIPTVLSSHYIVSYYGVKHFFGWSSPLYEVLLWTMVIGTYAHWIKECLKDGPMTTTEKDKDGFLVWCQTGYTLVGRLLYVSAILFPILVGFPNGLLKCVLLLGTGSTFLLNYNNVAFGSRWCWTTNALSIIFLAIVLMIKKPT